MPEMIRLVSSIKLIPFQGFSPLSYGMSALQKMGLNADGKSPSSDDDNDSN